nr:F-box protein SKIP23-like [Tanacetum cinerariifolium]
MMEWLDMLPEVLDIIAQKYITCYEDYPSFAGVCKSWRLAAARTYHNSNGPPTRLSSLLKVMIMGLVKFSSSETRASIMLCNSSILYLIKSSTFQT